MNESMQIILGISVYLLSSIPVYLLAKKAGANNAVFAFIPILNMYLIIDICGFPWWYMLLLLIPFLNIVLGLFIMYKFFSMYESGQIVFLIIIISGIAGAFMYVFSFIGIIAIWWLALSDRDIVY